MTSRISSWTQNIDPYRFGNENPKSHSSHAMVKKDSKKEEVTKGITAFWSVMDSTALFPSDVSAKICGYLFDLSSFLEFPVSNPSTFYAKTKFSCCNTDSWPHFGIIDEQTLPDVFDAEWRSCERGSPQYCIHTMNAAINRNNILIIEYIFLRVPGLLRSRDERGWTPLVTSILLRKYEAAKTLLELGADPNLPAESNGRFGMPLEASPLWIASQKIQDVRFVQLLMRYKRG